MFYLSWNGRWLAWCLRRFGWRALGTPHRASPLSICQRRASSAHERALHINLAVSGRSKLRPRSANNTRASTKRATNLRRATLIVMRFGGVHPSMYLIWARRRRPLIRLEQSRSGRRDATRISSLYSHAQRISLMTESGNCISLSTRASRRLLGETRVPKFSTNPRSGP